MEPGDFRRWYDTVSEDLHRYVRRLADGADEADDLFQETLVRYLGSGFDSDDPAERRRYLFRIATNLSRDRKRWSRRWGLGPLFERGGDPPETRYGDRIDVQRALARLPPAFASAALAGVRPRDGTQGDRRDRRRRLDQCPRVALPRAQEATPQPRKKTSMSRRAEEEWVLELLGSLAESEVTPPPADEAYWQARVRLALEYERARRASVLRPLRTLHLLMGFGALATAAVLIPFAPALGLFSAPSVFAAVALGARSLSEATPGRLC